MERASERVRRLDVVARTIEKIDIPTKEPRDRRYDTAVAVVIWILSGSVHLAHLVVMSRGFESLRSELQRDEYDHLVCTLAGWLAKQTQPCTWH